PLSAAEKAPRGSGRRSSGAETIRSERDFIARVVSSPGLPLLHRRSLVACRKRTARPCRGPRIAVLDELLVRQHADEDDRAHHGEVQRTRDAEEIDEVLQNLKQYRAEHDAEDRPLAAAQRA